MSRITPYRGLRTDVGTFAVSENGTKVMIGPVGRDRGSNYAK